MSHVQAPLPSPRSRPRRRGFSEFGASNVPPIIAQLNQALAHGVMVLITFSVSLPDRPARARLLDCSAKGGEAAYDLSIQTRSEHGNKHGVDQAERQRRPL